MLTALPENSPSSPSLLRRAAVRAGRRTSDAVASAVALTFVGQSTAVSWVVHVICGARVCVASRLFIEGAPSVEHDGSATDALHGQDEGPRRSPTRGDGTRGRQKNSERGECRTTMAAASRPSFISFLLPLRCAWPARQTGRRVFPALAASGPAPALQEKSVSAPAPRRMFFWSALVDPRA